MAGGAGAERKNSWTIAEQAGDLTPDGMQGEAKRLLAHLITTIPNRISTWAWSHWRRRHQYRAQQAHHQRRHT